MTERPEIGRAALAWWRAHIDDSQGEAGPKRMTRARLRRCDGAAEALAVEASHDLHRRLGGLLRHRADTLALVAIALANIRSPGPPAAERMGQLVPALRFQALLRVNEPSELIRPLRRALIQIGGQADVARLAADLARWDDAMRARWCFEFYDAASAAPASIIEEIAP